MSTLSHTREIAWFLVEPTIAMGQSLAHLPGTILAALRKGDWATLSSPSRLRTAWYGRFWAVRGPQVRRGNSQNVVPLLQGRVPNGLFVPADQKPGPPVGGVVMEVGAGSGMWVDAIAEAGGIARGAVAGGRDVEQGGGGTITKIYGIEPNPASHAALRRKVREAGLEGIYEVAPVGIEELGDPTKWNGRIDEGSIDCILSILCLCSIPDPEKHIATLYKYLKKGGRWYVYEHVTNRRNWSITLYQRFLNIFWPRIMGGCELCRDTEKHLRGVGPWEKIDLAQVPTEPWYYMIPHISGILIK
ncbi:hypothetical protein ACRALDRAFT_1068486 [Sodiomyces alcalophilus JCM 7366]|uniref:uncharacterized protein n=1 Tax=Sodiomyces alcalophilus JCM 7366 TaxID=591952 RepID=UPI0039B538EA